MRPSSCGSCSGRAMASRTATMPPTPRHSCIRRAINMFSNTSVLAIGIPLVCGRVTIACRRTPLERVCRSVFARPRATAHARTPRVSILEAVQSSTRNTAPTARLRWRWSNHAEILLVSFGALLIIEISYTRLISYKLFYYYVYLVIGLALLGIGTGPLAVAVSKRLRRAATDSVLFEFQCSAERAPSSLT